jgi:C-terminal processing protease CtpA/Prc
MYVQEVAGLRLVFSDKTGDVTVAAVLEGTPAASRGGVAEGDRVLMGRIYNPYTSDPLIKGS